MKKIAKSMILLYLVMLVLFTTLVIAVHTIPRSAIQQNAIKSVELFEREGSYPMKQSIDGKAVVDNFTDCYMLNVALCADASHPVDAAMRNYRYRGVLDMAESTRQLVDGKLIDKPFEYGKYWHGYQLTLRPLLTLTDYSGIRLLNGIAICLVLLLAIGLIWVRLSPVVAVSLLVSMAMVHTGVLPWSLQFSTCYYIALVSVILLLTLDKLPDTWQHQLMTFFAIGAVTSFLDFLTTPVITLGLPLAILILKGKKTDNKRLIVGLAVAWSVGYGLMWVSKWMMDYLLAGYNPMNQVTESLEIHSVGKQPEPVWSVWCKWIGLIQGRWSVFTYGGLLRWGVMAVVLVLAIVAPRGRKSVSENAWLLAVAALPVVWHAVVAHHSYTHFFITSRALLVWWFGVICFFGQIIDFQKLKSYVPFKS